MTHQEEVNLMGNSTACWQEAIKLFWLQFKDSPMLSIFIQLMMKDPAIKPEAVLEKFQ